MKYLILAIFFLSGCNFSDSKLVQEMNVKTYKQKFQDELFYAPDNKGNCYAVLLNPTYGQTYTPFVASFTLVAKGLCD